jgi:hypothetical protein
MCNAEYADIGLCGCGTDLLSCYREHVLPKTNRLFEVIIPWAAQFHLNIDPQFKPAALGKHLGNLFQISNDYFQDKRQHSTQAANGIRVTLDLWAALAAEDENLHGVVKGVLGKVVSSQAYADYRANISSSTTARDASDMLSNAYAVVLEQLVHAPLQWQEILAGMAFWILSGECWDDLPSEYMLLEELSLHRCLTE